jgi:hypothetical protein
MNKTGNILAKTSQQCACTVLLLDDQAMSWRSHSASLVQSIASYDLAV